MSGKLVDATAAPNGSQLCVGLYAPPPYDVSVAPMTVPRLSINLRSVPVQGGVDGGRHRVYAGRRYSLFLTPAGAHAHWRKAAPSRHLNIYFHPRTLEDASDGARTGATILEQPLMDVQRPAMRAFIDALEQAVARDGPFARDASTSLALLILAELLRQPVHRTPTLGTKVLADVRDYVAAYIDAPIRVAHLAAAAGMTPARFTVAFNATTGTSPHRFVLAQRVARAMELLKGRRLELAEVALACGFSSQQHLTTTMHRLAGTTPARVRRAASPTASDQAGVPSSMPSQYASVADPL